MSTPDIDRTRLAGLLHDALEALERGDEDGWRAHVDALANARARTLVTGLGRLAKELSQALGTLPPTPAEDAGLDDACARLDHVVDGLGRSPQRQVLHDRGHLDRDVVDVGAGHEA